MRAEIIAVGTELLLGQITNTNARTISGELAKIGVDVLFHTTVGDNLRRIAGAVSTALGRADVLIITGGLGPTHDDLTREAIAQATGRSLERRADLEEELRGRFARLGRTMAESNLSQADQPMGAVAIPNPLGTAPGIALEHDGKRIFAMPGVSIEMESMLGDFVLPELKKVGGEAVVMSRILAVVGLPESEIAQLLSGEIAQLNEGPTATLALLSGNGEVQIRITAKDADQKGAADRIAPVERRIREILGSAIYGTDGESLEGVISGMLREKGLTLAVAESVTGGMLASRLISVPGASKFLKAGFVAYSPEAKADLGVPWTLLERHGTVSPEAAVAMATSGRLTAGVDLGLATVGEAGPEPAEDAVGQVFVALAWDGGSLSRGLRAPGDRAVVRRWASNGALNLLRLWLMGEVS
jgi:nicotinamide-nucleotide amidase